MKLLGLLGAIAATTLTAVPATAAVTINGSIAVAVVGISSNTPSIGVGTIFNNTNVSIVGSTQGDFAGTVGNLVLSSLTASVGQTFSFTSDFGNYSGLVQTVDAEGGLNNRTVSAYILGLFTPLGTLSGYDPGLASATFSFTQSGLSAATSGSFTFASPPAPVPAVPEIATWGMMILGFGLMGASFRYRRQSAKVTFA